jgi:hypothetical protein
MNKLLQHRRIASILFVILAFASCKKNDIQEPDPTSKYAKQVKDWLDLKKDQEPNNFERINLLSENLNYSKIYEEKSVNNQKLVIIPIKAEYKSKRKINQDAITNLVVVLNQFRQVSKAYIVSLTPENIKSKKQGPNVSYYDLFYIGKGKGISDGKYVICNLLGTVKYEVKYIDGLMREQGIVQKRASNVGTMELKETEVIANPINKTETQLIKSNSIQSNFLDDCYVLYIETTYYDRGGNILGTSIRVLGVYGNCSEDNELSRSSGGSGGGGSDGSEETGPEFDYYSYPWFDAKPTGTDASEPWVRGHVTLHASWGKFVSVALSSQIARPDNIPKDEWWYVETKNDATFTNSGTPIATFAFRGTLYKNSTTTFPASASAQYYAPR